MMMISGNKLAQRTEMTAAKERVLAKARRLYLHTLKATLQPSERMIMPYMHYEFSMQRAAGLFSTRTWPLVILLRRAPRQSHLHKRSLAAFQKAGLL